MNKNAGFTLIELLAVLIILAIIALIITPIVTGLIMDAKIKAAVSATEGLIDSVEVYYGRHILKNNGVFNNLTDDNVYVTIEFNGQNGVDNKNYIDGDTEVKYKGFTVTGGTIKVNRNGNIEINLSDPLVINGHYCTNPDNKVTCVEIGESSIVKMINMNGVNVDIVSSEDGLYVDNYEKGRYVYKGADPDNYIWLDENGDNKRADKELYRIIAVENDSTLKVKRDIPNTYNAFDWGNSNLWSKCGTLCEDFNVSTNYSFYGGLSQNIKNKIQVHDFAVGPVKVNSNLLTQISDEKSVIWNGKIGLISLSDYLRANSNVEKCGNFSLVNTNYTVCVKTNYMLLDENLLWTINPYAPENNKLVLAHNNSSIHTAGPPYMYGGAAPTFYLKSSIKLSGQGTKSSPYIITN